VSKVLVPSLVVEALRLEISSLNKTIRLWKEFPANPAVSTSSVAKLDRLSLSCLAVTSLVFSEMVLGW
jgi:hypothetical protein